MNREQQEALREARLRKFAALPEGTLLRINPEAAVSSNGQPNSIICVYIIQDNHLHILGKVKTQNAYPVQAKSLLTGLADVFSVGELLMPGEEPTQFDITL